MSFIEPTRQSGNPRRRLLTAVAALPAIAGGLLAGCSGNPNRISAPVRPVPAAAVRSGERWRYQRINRYNNEPLGEILAEVIQVEPQVVVRLIDRQGKRWGEEIYSAPWQIIQEPLYNQTLRFAQPVPLLPEPLTDARGRRTETTYQTGSPPQRRRWQVRLEVPGWEKISVPAGQFDCLRVDRTIRFEPHQMSRFDARRHDTLWYAPAVNRWVRRDWTGFYLDETTLPDRPSALPPEEREDSVSWVLLEHQTAPVAT